MLPQWIIEEKRDGGELSAQEIRQFIDGYVIGEIPDYQMSAFAMAVFFQGMEFEETAALTEAMIDSGDLLDTSSITKPKVDKHSTGGIGDKISLILAPLAASCGLAVPMLSGRGLGITGGTLDKLESIPGYRCDLSEAEFLEVVSSCGCAITGQTETLAPADRKLYALRDVTGTVPSIPLITASILCKKLAEGIDALVLDVKAGSGAFMKSQEQAKILAESMVRVGSRMGKTVRALITDMSQPLGRCVGNVLEVKEAMAVLKGEGPEDLLDLTFKLGAQMLLMTKQVSTEEDAVSLLREKLEKGAALETFQQMVRLQGGDLRSLEKEDGLAQARFTFELCAKQPGIVLDVDAQALGRACLMLGAGRSKIEDSIDPAVGISDLVKRGEEVELNQLLLRIHANDQQRLNHAVELLEGAVQVGEQREEILPLVLDLIT